MNVLRTSRLPILVAAAAILPLLALGAEQQEVTGTWTMTVNTAYGPGNPTFTLTQKDGSISGTYKGVFGQAPVVGTIEGAEVVLKIEVNAQGQDLTVKYVGTVEGDSISGKVQFGEFGEGTFEGSRERPEPK